MDCKRTVDSAAAPLVLLVGNRTARLVPPFLGIGGIRDALLIVVVLPTTDPATSDSSRSTSAGQSTAARR
jgi:hypothetical protein